MEEKNKEIEDQNKNLEFLTFNKSTDGRTTNSPAPDNAYTDIISAMMNTPDEHHTNDHQYDVQANGKSDKPDEQNVDSNALEVEMDSVQNDNQGNSKDASQERKDSVNFTMDPKESEDALYPKLDEQ